MTAAPSSLTRSSELAQRATGLSIGPDSRLGLSGRGHFPAR